MIKDFKEKMDELKSILIRQNIEIEQLKMVRQDSEREVCKDANSDPNIAGGASQIRVAKRARRLIATDTRLNEECTDDWESDLKSLSTEPNEMETDVPVTLESLAAQIKTDRVEMKKITGQVVAATRFMQGMSRQTDEIVKALNALTQNLQPGAQIPERNMRLEYRTEKPAEQERTNIAPRATRPSRGGANQTEVQQKVSFTYAQAVRATGDAHKHVRNIHIPDGNEAIRKELLASSLCKDIDITSIKNNGKNLISVRCGNAIEAAKMTAKLTQTFENKINIVEVEVMKPMVKIVNVDVNIEEAELLNTILEQNKDIRALQEAAPQSFVLKRAYIIRAPKRAYRNVIIECATIKAIRRPC